MAEVLDEQGMKSYTFCEIRRYRVTCSSKKSHTRMGLGGLAGSSPCPVASAVPNICNPELHGSSDHRESKGAPKCCPEVSCW